MSEGVVADGVAFVIDAFGDPRKFVGLNADQKKRGLSVLPLQHVENLRRPLRIGAVVKRQNYFVWTITVTRHAIGFWQVLEILIGNYLCICIDGEVACAVSGTVFDAQDFALAFHIHILAGRYVAQFIGRPGIARNVPYPPQGPVLAAQPPQSEGLYAQRLRRPHVVQRRDRIQKPDVVADAALIQVTEMGVERVVVENYIFIRIARRQPRFLHGDGAVVRVGRQQLSLLWLKHPVISIVSDSADQFFPGDYFHRGLEIIHEPILRRDRAGSGPRVVLIVVHDDHAIRRRSDRRVVETLAPRRHAHIQLHPAGVQV